MVYSTRRFVFCLTLCHFVLVFFSPFSIAITSLGEERANLSAFRKFVRFVLIWICRFPLPLGVWEGLRFVIVALPGLFSYLFFHFQTHLKVMIAKNFRIALSKLRISYIRLEVKTGRFARPNVVHNPERIYKVSCKLQNEYHL